MNELPQIFTSGTASSSYNLSNAGMFFPTTTQTIPYQYQTTDDDLTLTTEEKPNMSNRRIVQVYIADPNESVPLEKSLLYQDDAPHLTDLTDQELFFEIDIKNILDKHNEYRVTVKDKEASEGKNNDVMLEKAKIRDLKMTVVEIAKF